VGLFIYMPPIFSVSFSIRIQATGLAQSV
jgi:hypothetical protein